MKTHFTLLTCLFLSWKAGGLQAQNGPVGTGGEAFGLGNVLNYSIGQIDYLAVNTAGGSMNQGLQQPYELLILSAGEYEQPVPGLLAFPNPVSDRLIIRNEKPGATGLRYKLEDAQGRVIDEQEITGSETPVPVAGLASGVYLVQVSSGPLLLKTFKIIKN